MEQIEAAWDEIARPSIELQDLTPPTQRAQRVSVVLVLLTVATALLLGWALMTVVQGRTLTYTDDQVSLRYPARWTTGQDDLGHSLLADPEMTISQFRDRVAIVHEPLPDSGLPGSSPLVQAATAWSLRRARTMEGYRSLATDDGGRSDTDPGLMVAGQPAIRVDYAFVADPSAELGRPGLPVVVRGSDLIMILGDGMTVVVGQSNAERWQDFQPLLQQIVDTVMSSG